MKTITESELRRMFSKLGLNTQYLPSNQRKYLDLLEKQTKQLKGKMSSLKKLKDTFRGFEDTCRKGF